MKCEACGQEIKLRNDVSLNITKGNANWLGVFHDLNCLQDWLKRKHIIEGGL